MTISTEPAVLSYSGDDATVAFSITWKYFATTDVVATLRSSAGAETTWVLNTDYTLSAAGVDTGGTLTATTAPASGTTLVITLDPPNTQTSSLPRGGAFPSSTVEDALDQAAQRDAKLEILWDRAIRVKKTDTQTGTELELPIDSSRASKYLYFDSNGAPTASAGTGTLDVVDTLDLSNAAAGQIKFPATQHASTDANTLDDYEEGTWTPVISDGTNNATTDAQEGDYTKIGNRVFFSGKIAISSLGSVSGDIRVTGLPFASSGTTQGNAGGCTVTYATGLNVTAGYNVTGQIGNAVSYILLYLWDNAAGPTAMQGTELSADGRLDFTGSYQVA